MRDRMTVVWAPLDSSRNTTSQSKDADPRSAKRARTPSASSRRVAVARTGSTTSAPNSIEPLLMTGFLFWLLAFRVVQRYARDVTFPWLLALAAFATLFTALYEAVWYGVLTGVDARRILAVNLDVSDFSMLRPAVWVLVVTLAIALAGGMWRWLKPREPARVRLNPAE